MNSVRLLTLCLLAPLLMAATHAPKKTNKGPRIEVVSENGFDDKGVHSVDAYEGDRVYMAIQLSAADGKPLADRPVTFVPQRSRVIPMGSATNPDGYLEFQMIAGNAGLETIRINAEGIEQKFRLNVVKGQQNPWFEKISKARVTPWESLLEAEVHLEQTRVKATFTESVKKLEGTRVRLAGFMLPLQPTREQKHFLITANPPTCFFHVPGGPSTVAEVFSKEDIRGSWDPLVIEGTLKLVADSEQGILYQLLDAKQIKL